MRAPNHAAQIMLYFPLSLQEVMSNAKRCMGLGSTNQWEYVIIGTGGYGSREVAQGL